MKSDWPATSSLALALRSGVAWALGEASAVYQLPMAVQTIVAGGLRVARVADDEAAGHGFKLGRHGNVLEVDAGNAVELPAIVAGCGLAGD